MSYAVRADVTIALVISAGLGVLLGLVLSVLSVLHGLALSTIVITPSQDQRERVAANPVATGQFAPDTAWPLYPLRQVRADVPRMWREFTTRFRKLWKWPAPVAARVIFFPLSAAAVLCLAVAGLTGAVICGLLALMAQISAAAGTVAFVTISSLLRVAERGWCAVMGAESSCPRCYHVTARPAYRCPGCSRLHRDLRAGRLGLFTRRCACGKLLPTMAVRAAWRLTAICQRCGAPLARGSAAIRDVRIAIIGDTSAGKTRFLYAGLDSLMATASQDGVSLGFPDESQAGEVAGALGQLRSGADTVPTQDALAAPLTCLLGSGPVSTLLHLFDAAGQHFAGPRMHDALGFLAHSHGLIYLLDPFAIDGIEKQMTGPNVTSPGFFHATGHDPDVAYVEVVSHLRGSGVRCGAQRLAVVVAKADLLSAGGLDLPGESGAITRWLTQMGVHNLVLSARRDFAEVRYFAVASNPAQEGKPHDPGAPLRWLLGGRGTWLPGDPLIRLAHDSELGRGRLRRGGPRRGGDLAEADPAGERRDLAEDATAEVRG
jgi:hypothetical protein